MDRSTQELIRGYLVKAEEKLGVVNRLLAQRDFEDAVSRAYYAAFYAAQALLLSEDLESRSHGGLVDLIGLHFVKTGKLEKKFGRYLSNLMEDRQQSDYNLFSGLEKEDAEQSLEEAKAFVAEIRRQLSDYL
ncbi:MAG: HEPN domain-containing protein [Acidobacteria bacterium]|nr:HEPN domain-containing protein [Acidobacteriota bacterium]